MDEEELNNRLSARITEVFDTYEDTTANEGWALLRQKFPEEKKDRGLIWLWYGAAAVLLLGFGLWFLQGPANVKQQVAVNIKPDTKTQQATKINTNDTESDTSQNRGKVNTVVATKPSAPVSSSPAQTITPTRQSIAQAKTRNAGISINPSGQKVIVNKPAVNPAQANSPGAQPQVPVTNNYVATNPAKANTVTKTVVNDPAVADSLKNTTAVIAQNPVKPVTKPALTSAEALDKLFAETANTPKDVKQGAKKGRKPVIGVYAATYFNYADGSDNRVNVGAGFSSDFSITNKLKLSTGLSVGQNTLNYNYGTDNNNSNTKYNLLTGSQASADASIGTGLSSSGLYNVGSRTESARQNFSANLIGLDIPINIKYQFNPKKNDTYVSAGFSSGTFINETYKLEYIATRQTQETTTQNSFNDFYFAKTLNVSFGMGYPLGKSNRLVVEPFLKYPLSGLGSQQIKFGAGGINLKLNFTTQKK